MNLVSKIYFILTKQNKKKSILFFFFLILATIFEVLSISLIFPAVTILINADLPDSLQFIDRGLETLSIITGLNYMIAGIAILILVFFLKNIFLLYYFWWKNGYSNDVQKHLSQRLFMTYLRQPYAFHLQRNSSELIRNLVNEVSTFQKTFQSGLELVFEIFVLFSILILIFVAEPKGAFIVFLLITIFSLIIYFITSKKVKNWGKIRLSLSSKYFQNVTQAIGSIKDIILTGRENNFLYNHYDQKSILTKIQQKFATITILPRFLFEFLAVFGILSLIIFFISEGRSYENILPSVSLFAMAGYRLLPSANRILIAAQGFRFRYMSIDILYDELRLHDLNKKKVDNEFFEPVDPSIEKPLKIKNPFSDKIEIIDLSYNYQNIKTNTLKNINLIIERGQSVGIFGASGSGKSTLVSLMLGLLEPTYGKIKIDGNNLNEIKSTWQKNIGYVPQSVYLTDDTISQNIAFGLSKNQINNEMVEKAIKASQLKKFVNSLDKGKETLVGENGVRLSGGQVQRIGIARALYHNPSVVVFDEATSSLDYETEKELMKDINMLKSNKTLIIIAHRLTTVEECDFVIKLESGKIIERGKPEVILKK
jgi:ATP-binding cassette, subfamily B, bacterial PglK